MEILKYNNRDFIKLNGRHRIPTEILALDTENANSDSNIEEKHTFLWAIQMGGINETLESGTWLYSSWEDVFANLRQRLQPFYSNMKHKEYPNIIIYVHNLSHDWSHLKPYIVENFTWGPIDEDTRKLPSEINVYNMVSTKTESSIYSIKMRLKGCTGIIEFRDSSKILKGSLKNLALSYNTETKKLDESESFYRKERTLPYTLTEEEKQYCYQDIRVILECLYKHIERDDKNFFKSLSAASYAKNTMLDAIYGGTRESKLKRYRRTYPKLSDEENNFVSKAYQGGLAFTAPQYNGKDIRKIVDHYDAHQHYPSCASNFPMPYGKGVFKTGKPEFREDKFQIMKLNIKYDAVIFPLDIILMSNYYFYGIGFKQTVYWPSCYFNFSDRKNIDIKFSVYDCYKNLKIDWDSCEYYEYNVKELEYAKFFKDNWDKRMIAKKNKDFFGIAIYKLFNNSLYGKTAEKKKHDILKMEYDDESELWNLTSTDDGKSDMNAAITYFPVAVAITAYGRCRLGAFAKLIGFKNLVKTDTDSLFYIRTKKNAKVIKEKLNLRNELNGWGNENESDCIRFCSAGGKRYKELFANDDVKFTCCGVSKSYIEKILTVKMSGTQKYEDLNVLDGEFEATTFIRDKINGAKMIVSKKKKLSLKLGTLFSDYINRRGKILTSTEQLIKI